MVADKLRSLRLSFAFIENRMTLTTLTTCQILAALVLLPLDFPRSLFVWGLEGGGRPRHSEKFGLCLSPCPNTHTCPYPHPSESCLDFKVWDLASLPLSHPFLATLPPPCFSGIYFRGEPSQNAEEDLWLCFYARISVLDFLLCKRKKSEGRQARKGRCLKKFFQNDSKEYPFSLSGAPPLRKTPPPWLSLETWWKPEGDAGLSPPPLPTG